PGDPITTAQAEMMFSTQIINDRVTINGNVDIGGTQVTNKTTNNIVGEGNIEFKLNEKGKLRLRAFNRSNQQNLLVGNEVSPYTQGVGVFYKEDFNSFKDLMKNYFDKLFGKKQDAPQPVQDTDEDSEN
ncbi:MAG TPA: translocation/assembly module TamB domain-containing protein, partial [Bacteroidales bacterium]